MAKKTQIIHLLLILLVGGCTGQNKTSQYDSAEVFHDKNKNEKVNKLVLIYTPTEEQINEQKKELGEDNFLIIVDDNNFYNSLAIEFLDSLSVEVVFSSEKILKFPALNGQEYEINRLTLSEKNWGAFYYDGINPPILIDVMKIRDLLTLLTE